MSPNIITITITILTILILFISPITSSSTNPTTAYDIIQSYGFPKGILPIGVTGYTLDTNTGNFQAFFNKTCSFSLENTYDLKYQPTISGIISNGRLTNLSGVSVKVLFFWLNIVEVYVSNNGDGGVSELGFSVGIYSAGFPIDNFEECPQCGCGMDCNGVIRDGTLVASL